jgi:hypothetical protein
MKPYIEEQVKKLAGSNRTLERVHIAIRKANIEPEIKQKALTELTTARMQISLTISALEQTI